MASVTPVFLAGRRLIVPLSFSFTAPLSGDDFVEIPFFFSGALTYLKVETNATPEPKGKVRLEFVDLGQDIFRDPKPTNPDVFLDFYTQEVSIPVNGNYKLHLENLPAGDYLGFMMLELRERRL